MMGLREVHEDQPLTWPIQLPEAYSQAITLLCVEGRLPHYLRGIANGERLRDIDDVNDLHCCLWSLCGSGGDRVECDLYRELERIQRIWLRSREYH